MNEFPPDGQNNLPIKEKSSWYANVSVIAAALLLVGGTTLGFIWFVPPTFLQQTSQEDAETAETAFVADSYIVGVSRDVSLESAQETLKSLGATVKYALPLSYVVVVTVEEDALTTLRQHPDVLWVERQGLAEPTGALRLLLAATQPSTASETVSSERVVDVFILDDGAGTLATLNYSSKSTVTAEVGTNFPGGHGEAVALAFTETLQTLDNASSIRLHSIGMGGGPDGAGPKGPGIDIIAEAILQAVNQGAEVINLSYGYTTEESTVFNNAIEEAKKAGVSVIISAGNDFDDTTNYLLKDPYVISVGALARDGTLANYSSGLTPENKADVFANGDLDFFGGVIKGTSVAAPRTAALVASIRAKAIDPTFDKDGDGAWDPDEVEARLLYGAGNREYAAVRLNEGVEALLRPQVPQVLAGAPLSSPIVTPPQPGESETLGGTPILSPVLTPPENQPSSLNSQGPEYYGPGAASQPSSLNSQGPEYYGSSLAVEPAQAATQRTEPPGGLGGLVPCNGIDCDLCDLGTLMQKIINFLIGLSIPIAAAMFAYAGFLYVTGASNPTRISKAHSIFKRVLIGFLIAISAWLVVQTILSVVFDKSFWIGGNWNQLQCVDDEERLMNTNFGDLINTIIPKPPAPLVVSTQTSYSYSCAVGTYSERTETCVDAQGATIAGQLPTVTQTSSAATSQAVSSRQCGLNSSAFGSSASLMSCICGAESAGIANRPSRTDVMRANGQAFSWGLYQINLTANEVRCPNQPVLNCPNAFNGRNYDATIKDQALYDRCVAAAQNVQCNTATAQYLLNSTPKGATNWSTYNGCTGQ